MIVMQLLYAGMGCAWLAIGAWSAAAAFGLVDPVRNAEGVLFGASIVVAIDNFRWAREAGKP